MEVICFKSKLPFYFSGLRDRSFCKVFIQFNHGHRKINPNRNNI